MGFRDKISSAAKYFGLPRKLVGPPASAPRGKSCVIVVLGMAGSGRSTFIDAAAGRRIATSTSRYNTHSLERRTTTFQTLHHYSQDHDCTFTFIDTPGLDQSDVASQFSAECLISAKRQIDAIIYMHRITDARLADPSVQHGKLFYDLAGVDWESKALFVTSPCGARREGAAEERRYRELKEIYWRSATQKGAQVSRFSGGRSDALRLVALVYNQVNRTPIPSTIIVLGPAGAGKTTFVELATEGLPPSPSQETLDHTLSEIQPKEHTLGRHNLTFVDTPAIDADGSKAILLTFSKSLSDKKAVAIIYLHGIDANRAFDLAKYESILISLAGGDWRKRTLFATTRWDQVELSDAERREKELKSNQWLPALQKEPQAARCKASKDDALRLINYLVPFM